MTNWTVRAYSDRFSIETPTGERIAYVDPYERGGYLVPLDHVRGVALRDLVRALRSEHACDEMMISRQREQWIDLDTASPDFTLAPGEPRRFEVEFIFDQAADIADDDNDAEGRRLAALLTPLVQGYRGKVVSVELHPSAYEPPWPYVIVLSLPLNAAVLGRQDHERRRILLHGRLRVRLGQGITVKAYVRLARAPARRQDRHSPSSTTSYAQLAASRFQPLGQEQHDALH